MGGRGDAEMYLGGAGIAHHLDDLARGGTAHDRIVHQYHSLASELGAVGTVLQAHPEMADLIGGLDEGAADIMVANDAELEGILAALAIAQRGGNAGIGHRDHHVGIDGGFGGQHLAEGFARFIDAAGPPPLESGRGEIDVLSKTQKRLC